MAAALNDSHCAAIPSGSTAMAAAQPSSSDSLAPPLRRRSRFVFDRRYGWIFDEWKDPSEQALSGGRGMFCALTIARSLVNSAASSISYASSSVNRVLESHKSFSLPAYIPSLAFNKKQKAWLRELEKSGAVADLKFIDSECMTTECICRTRHHDHFL